MAQDLASPRERSDAETLRPPGLRFGHAQATRPVAERPLHGVPLFVGFGKPKRSFARRAPPALEVDSLEHFNALVAPHEGSFLGPAVQGFFANGGRWCAVLPVDVAEGEPCAQALQAMFAEGGAMENVTGIDLVCVPDAVSPLAGPATAMADVQAAVAARCEVLGDRFALLDALPAPAGVDLEALRAQAARHKTAYAALYFPWLNVDARPVPPCGHVAGVYARTDARAGVGKAPANETLDGAWAAEWDIDDALHAELNEAGVNCIRAAAGRGLRVWGARTLSGHGDWLYVPVARVFIALRRWLEQHMVDVAFESQTPALWQRAERRIGAFCRELLDTGALAGVDAERAYFVQCDAELNPPTSRDAGQLVALVGLAPAVPAEFVVVRIVHDASGIELTPASN